MNPYPFCGKFSKIKMKAYLDIETSFQGEITVVGVYRPGGGFKQIWGEDVRQDTLIALLEGAEFLMTYGGSRFDLPIINRSLGVRLDKLFVHRDLLFDCWNFRLYGGLKAVEKELGIKREIEEVNGFMAMELWEKHRTSGDEEALRKLLLYNQQDVMNLVKIEEKLNTFYQLDFLPFAREL